MLSFDSEHRLANLLVAVGDGERKLESLRQRLCLIRDFAPHSAFQRIDRDATGRIKSVELLNFLRDHHSLSASESELFYLVKFFDSDNDGALSFQDFLQMLLPCEDNCLRNVTLDRKAMRCGRFDNLPLDIEHAMLAVLEQELMLQRQLEHAKHEVESRCDYTPHAAFHSVDRHNDGYITVCNLGTFLRAHGTYALEAELVQIIRRIDTDGDNRVNFNEFGDFIRSHHPAIRLASPVRCPSPVRLYSPVRNCSPVLRHSPVRHHSPVYVHRSPVYVHHSPVIYHSPVRHSSPVHHYSPVHRSPVIVHHSPVRYHSPVRHSSPLRECSPVVLHHSPVRLPHSPIRHHSPMHVYHSPVRPLTSPVRSYSPYRSPCKPILHPHEEDALVQGLRDLIAQERELENSKTSLTMKPDFNLHDAFTIFDHCRHGSVTQADLREGLAAIGIFPKADEIDLFFRRYDVNHDHRLNFGEFGDAFVAQDSYYAHMLNRRPSNHRNHLLRRDDCFFPDTQVEFRNMWRVHFKVEVAAEAVRQRLACHPHFNVVQAFNSLDLNSDGRVNSCEIKRIIESRGFYVTQKEANQVLKKFDDNKDGAVTFHEFKGEIEPKSPVRHGY